MERSLSGSLPPASASRATPAPTRGLPVRPTPSWHLSSAGLPCTALRSAPLAPPPAFTGLPHARAPPIPLCPPASPLLRCRPMAARHTLFRAPPPPPITPPAQPLLGPPLLHRFPPAPRCLCAICSRPALESMPPAPDRAVISMSRVRPFCACDPAPGRQPSIHRCSFPEGGVRTGDKASSTDRSRPAPVLRHAVVAGRITGPVLPCHPVEDPEPSARPTPESFVLPRPLWL
jgi:hypothetical protein